MKNIISRVTVNRSIGNILKRGIIFIPATDEQEVGDWLEIYREQNRQVIVSGRKIPIFTKEIVSVYIIDWGYDTKEKAIMISFKCLEKIPPNLRG